MSTVLVSPLPFTAASTTPAATAPITHANNDESGMAWIAPQESSYAIIDLGTGASYDWVALIGTNLRSTDTVQIRTGTTNTGIGGYAGTALPAWTGTKPDLSRADAIFRLNTVRGERYVRVDVSAVDDVVSVFRLVVGMGIYTAGVTFEAEMGFEDPSSKQEGPGYRSIDYYPVVPTWKVPVAWTSEVQRKTQIYNLLQRAGNSRGILFILNDEHPEDWQTDALYGFIANKVGGKAVAYDAWAYEFQLQAYVA